MISYLTGKIQDLNPKTLTLLTSTGVGYKVFVPFHILIAKKPNEELALFIHTVVKDDAIDLYGFLTKDELLIFESLISVSNVGPRSALSILSSSSLESIVSAIESEDASTLAKVPGLGKRTSEKIIIELKGKLPEINIEKTNSHGRTSEEADARLALETFGYSEKNITEAINTLKKRTENFEKLNTGEIIREALKHLN